MNQRNMLNNGNQFPIMQTLRLLSAIEEDLGLIGSQINTFLMRINTIEIDSNTCSNYNSALFLKDKKFLARSLK